MACIGKSLKYLERENPGNIAIEGKKPLLYSDLSKNHKINYNLP